MNSWDHSIQALAGRMNPDSQGESGQPGMRAELEERLTPLIRCVLRTGAGVPALVQWVRRTLPHLPSASVEQTAPRMARLLCAELFRPGKRQDTVAGRLAGVDTVAGD